jgi:hypothetical protein
MPNHSTDYGFDMNAFLQSYNQSILGNLGGQQGQQGQQNNLSILRGFFPSSGYPGLTDEMLSEYTGFLGEIPEELYDLTDPESDYYTLQRGERVGFLQGDINTSLSGNLKSLQQGLFQTSREARGMQGKRGFLQGRDFMREVRGEARREQSRRGRELSDTYGKGLYSINEDILGQLDENRRYVASLEADQRRTALDIGRAAEIFGNETYTNAEEGAFSTNAGFVPWSGDVNWTNWSSLYDPNYDEEEMLP